MGRHPGPDRAIRRPRPCSTRPGRHGPSVSRRRSGRAEPEGPAARGEVQAGERQDRRGLRARVPVPRSGRLLRRPRQRARGQREPLPRGEGPAPRDRGLERKGRGERVARARNRGARRPAPGLLGRGANHRRQGRHVQRRRQGGGLDQGRLRHLLRRADRDAAGLLDRSQSHALRDGAACAAGAPPGGRSPGTSGRSRGRDLPYDARP